MEFEIWEKCTQEKLEVATIVTKVKENSLEWQGEMLWTTITYNSKEKRLHLTSVSSMAMRKVVKAIIGPRLELFDNKDLPQYNSN